MSSDSLIKKQKFHSFNQHSRKPSAFVNKTFHHSESTDYGDYTVKVISESDHNLSVETDQSTTQASLRSSPRKGKEFLVGDAAKNSQKTLTPR